MMKSYIGDFIHEFVMKHRGFIEDDEEAFGTTVAEQVTGFFEEIQKSVIHKGREMGVDLLY